MSTAPVIVLIGGAWHTSASYAKFTSALQATGLEVHCPPHASISNSRPPTADLSTDTTLIHDYVESIVDLGRNVVAIMHSYGGQVGTNALTALGTTARAAQGKIGGVSHLVYMCAFALFEGQSMVDKVKEFGHEYLIPLAMDFAEDESVMNRDPKTLILGPGLSDKEANEYVDSLVRWNGKCMYQEIGQCAWRGIPVMYIMATEDMSVPLDYQKDMVMKIRVAGARVDTVELSTGHCPHATMTTECVAVIKSVAAIYTK